MTHPKPAKRGPKPRKRIPRKTRLRPRRTSASAAMAREAASLWSLIVRARAWHRCEWVDNTLGYRCIQHATDAAHARGKKAHPETRYYLGAGVALCRAHHESVASGPRMRDLYVALRGPRQWEELIMASWVRSKLDEAALEDLRLRAAAYK